MSIEIKIPSPGESITEVEIANWFVKTGDYVEKDQEIAELESDKATLSLTAEKSGEIKVLIEEGETAEVGAVACTIDTEAKAPEKKQEKKSKPDNSKSQDKKDTPSQKETEEEESEETHKKTNSEDKIPDSLKITPVAKEMLKEKGISAEEFIGKLKRITSKEVNYVLSQPEPKESEQKKKRTERNEDRKKMSSLRKKLSKRLVAVKNETAMLTTFNEVDMSRVIQLRTAYKAKFQEKHGVKLGFMSFFTRAASIALQHHPNINSMIDGEEIVHFNYTDIGIAVQTPKGLMVPIIRNVDELTLPETEVEISNMAQKARNAKISLDEMSGGTFTITNGGVFGSLLSTPIINPPQAGILGMHNIQERPVAEDGKVVIRPMMYIALSYDHRLVDGKDSVGFLVKIKELIEHPESMLFSGENMAEKLILR